MKQYKNGTLWSRFFALIVDNILIAILLIILENITQSKNQFLFNTMLFTLVPPLYGTLMIYFFETTIGKRLFKLRVVTSSYKKVSFFSALLRESVGKYLSGVVFSLGYLTALLNPEKKTWHDTIAKTQVVSVTAKGQMLPAVPTKITVKNKIAFGLLLIVVNIPFLLFILFFVSAFIVKPVHVRGTGMIPNYLDGQYYIVNKLVYRSNEPKRGDVILYRAPKDSEYTYFRRIIGLPGESIQLSQGKVLINGQTLVEPYLPQDSYTIDDSAIVEGQTVFIPEFHYFVLSDNRYSTVDSRVHGVVKKSDIIGKMTFCYWNCN